MARPGLYAKYMQRKKLIKKGSNEKMRKTGTKGILQKLIVVRSAMTAKKTKKKS